ncbi:PH domain-containing protein [Sutcliffiella halmapala]|uniref:PH domain-containing protein n=1 Tax=Sutcliffiella halmapala TaxID=79882 RepID=UPI002E267C5F
MGTIPLLPLYKEASISILIILSAIYLISAGFLLWYVISIRYVICKDYLVIKGGPFKSKIPYQNITKVSLTTESLTGYRISSSDKGIELFYESARHGSIKILPKNKRVFVSELRKRCPNAQIQGFE